MVVIAVNDEQQMETELVIFDKDGTLISHQHYIPIMEARARIIAQTLDLSQEVEKGLLEVLGVDPERKFIMPQGNIYTPRRDTFREVVQFLGIEGIKKKIAGEAARIGFKDADKEVKMEEHVKSIPGATDLLQALAEAEVKIAVCTHDISQAAKLHLRATNLLPYITKVIGLDPKSGLRAKPAPDMLERASRECRVATSKGIMVGDAEIDMQAGKAAKAGLCIGVLTGQTSKEEFYSADVIIESVGQIKVL
ncbi:MAG: HAD family hydrolase [Candidatus Hodarchaeales archaeon]